MWFATMQRLVADRWLSLGTNLLGCFVALFADFVSALRIPPLRVFAAGIPCHPGSPLLHS